MSGINKKCFELFLFLFGLLKGTFGETAMRQEKAEKQIGEISPQGVSVLIVRFANYKHS